MKQWDEWDTFIFLFQTLKKNKKEKGKRKKVKKKRIVKFEITILKYPIRPTKANV